MERSETYSLFMGTDVACRILGIDPQIMLEKSGLAHLAGGRSELRGTAEQYFHSWNIIGAMSSRTDYVPYLAVAIARGPVIPVFFTLSCAPDMETGLMRLAQFTSLLGPTRMRVFWDGHLLRAEYQSTDSQIVMPPSLGALQIVCLVEKIRGATSHHILPVAAGFDGSEEDRRQVAHQLGIMPERSDIAFVTFSPDDTKRRFISENPNLWRDIEADLELQLAAQNDRLPMVARVRGALVDLMPSGRTGADDVTDVLGLSRSTLQRRLREEGTTYQTVLDATRRDIAIRYLTKTNLRAEEIAKILAYGDAKSFSRSFRKWTGIPPLAFRQEAASKATVSRSADQDGR